MRRYALPKRHDISWQLIQIWVGEFEAGALESDVQAAGLQHTHRAEHRVLADVPSAPQRQQTEVFRLSSKRDVAAAKAFFRKAIKGQGSTPRTITLDGYAASHRAVREMKAEGQMPTDTKLRSSKYLNNLIEQDHRGVKARIGPMLGFKRFRTAAVTIAGIELLRRIRKGQFNLRRLRLNGRGAPAIWNAVLAA